VPDNFPVGTAQLTATFDSGPLAGIVTAKHAITIAKGKTGSQK